MNHRDTAKITEWVKRRWFSRSTQNWGGVLTSVVIL